jgi:hypothetical protein
MKRPFERITSSGPFSFLLGIAILLGVLLVPYFLFFTVIELVYENSTVFAIALLVLPIPVSLLKYRQVRLPINSRYDGLSETEDTLRDLRRWKKESSYIFFFGLFVSVITALNVYYDFVAAPLIFIIYSIYIFVIIHLINLGAMDIARLKNAVAALEGNRDSSKVAQSGLIFILAISIISGNWYYQIQRNQGIQQQIGMNEAVNLVGAGQCQTFWDVSAFPREEGGFDISKTGGWPCITVGSVSNIWFKKTGKDSELCLSYELKKSDGPPSFPNSIDTYAYGGTCTEQSGYGNSWNEDSLLQKVRKELDWESELSRLQVTLCIKYRYQMSYEEKNVYC